MYYNTDRGKSCGVLTCLTQCHEHYKCLVNGSPYYSYLFWLFKHTFLYVFKCKLREREQPPRFAQPGTFEFEYASRWKALDEMEKQQREQVDRNIREAKEKLEAEMEAARHEHQLMLMRQGKNGFSCR